MTTKRDITLKVLANESLACMERNNNNLYPLFLTNAKAVALIWLKRTACGYARVTGHGILLTKLPATSIASKGLPRGLTNWSAPLFIKVSASGGGFAFGKSTSESWCLAMAETLVNELQTQKGHRIFGLDASFSCGSGKFETSDLIHVATGDLQLINMGFSKGAMFNLSLVGGHMTVDCEKLKEIYGPLATTEGVLYGEIAPPSHFQPVYHFLNELTTESKSEMESFSRLSSSLERYTTGFDPDSHEASGSMAS